MKIILISGLSGSGKTVALNYLEDNGYCCTDNLPAPLLNELPDLHARSGRTEPLGISIDIRSRPDIAALLDTIAKLRSNGHQIDILFLEASDAALMRRFAETRRRHPLSGPSLTLPESLQQERNHLASLRETAYCIDTSTLNSRQLHNHLAQWLPIEKNTLLLSIESFGFKYGAPNADFVFDVRSLPNPFYRSDLRPLNGNDTPIRDFFAQFPDAQNTATDIETFLRRRLPSIRSAGRSYITIAIGCTGGQHRSVYIAAELAKRLQTDWRILLRHRQLNQPAS